MQGENDKLLVVWIFLYPWLVPILVLVVFHLYVCVCVLDHFWLTWQYAPICSSSLLMLLLFFAFKFIVRFTFDSWIRFLLRLSNCIRYSNWKYRLPNATLFKPQQPYKRCIAETLKDFPPSLPLIESLLSIDPDERGTATAALNSEVSNYCSVFSYAFINCFSIKLKELHI